MTVNIISDIHATLGKNDSVIYNLPFMHKHSKYIKTAECLREYWRSHADELKWLIIAFGYLHIAFPETLPLKSHEEVCTLL